MAQFRRNYSPLTTYYISESSWNSADGANVLQAAGEEEQASAQASS